MSKKKEDFNDNFYIDDIFSLEKDKVTKLEGKAEFKIEANELGALKHLEGKLRLDLIPPAAIKGMGEGFTYGSDKYGDHNWLKGIKYTTSYAATLRHLISFFEGEDFDKESGLNHIHHALTNLAMLAYNISTGRKELDDRKFKKE